MASDAWQVFLDIVLANDPKHFQDQSCIDPGAAAGGEGGRAGVVVGAGVAGAARDGAGMLEAAFGGECLLTGGVSTGASLWTGPNRVNGGLLRGGG